MPIIIDNKSYSSFEEYYKMLKEKQSSSPEFIKHKAFNGVKVEIGYKLCHVFLGDEKRLYIKSLVKLRKKYPNMPFISTIDNLELEQNQVKVYFNDYEIYYTFNKVPELLDSKRIRKRKLRAIRKKIISSIKIIVKKEIEVEQDERGFIGNPYVKAKLQLLQHELEQKNESNDTNS